MFVIFVNLFTNREAINNLFLFGLSGGIFIFAYGFETLSFFLINSDDTSHHSYAKLLFQISQFLISVPPLLFMYYIVRYFKPHSSFKAFLPVSFEFALELVYQPLGITNAISVSIINGNEVKHWIYDPEQIWINGLYYLSIVWFVGYLSYLILQSRSGTLDENTIKLQNTFLFGITIMFIISPLVFFLNNFISSDLIRFYWIAIVGRSFLIMGMTVFMLSFYNSSKLNDFFQPQPIEALYLLNAMTGELLYSRNFRVNDESITQENIAMNITMINRMVGDALGFRSLITEINFRNKEFLIQNLAEWNLISILVVSFSTDIIVERYEKLTVDLISYANYNKADLDLIIDSAFGY